MRASCFTEFQPLEEIIVGSTYSRDIIQNIQDSELASYFDRILYETEEDLQQLENLLKKCGVQVRRMNVHHNPGGDFNTGVGEINLQSIEVKYPQPPLMPRDLFGVYGNLLISFFGKNPERYLEGWSVYEHFLEYVKQGATWVSMPMPPLNEEIWSQEYSELHESKILFHGANVIKCGKDLFVSGLTPDYSRGKGTQLGRQWFESVAGRDFRINDAPCGGHIDGKISLIRPGLLACWNPKHLPEKLQSWDVIRIPDTHANIPRELKDIRKKKFYKDFIKKYLTNWIGYCDESVFDVNLLSVNENLVITNGYRDDIEKMFKKFNVEIIPMHFRHTHFWDGAIHCLTLDTRRSGAQEDYF